MFKKYKFRDYRFRLIAYVLFLTLLGYMVIGSAKESLQSRQAMGILIGIVMMVIFSMIDYQLILKFRRPIYLILNVLLVAVLINGHNSNGSTRWIEIFGVQFQPSELCKVFLIIFFASYFMRFRDKINSLPVLVGAIILILIPCALILREPDLSTTIATMLIFITLLFIAGLSYKIILGVVSVVVPLGVVGLILVMRHALPLEEYQYSRILSWIQPEKYQDTSRQQQNSIIAIGSGQLWGKGLNNSSVASLKNGNYLSESHTDFIFTVIGEELGFVGCLLVIVLIVLIVLELIMIARKAPDTGGKLFCCGMAAWIGFQSFINICVTTGLMPNTGLALPFVSYGLTALVSLYIGIGIALNVGLQARKYTSGRVE